MMINSIVEQVTENIIKRSSRTRKNYMAKIEAAKEAGRAKSHLSCGNFAHAIAASSSKDKQLQLSDHSANIAIVTSYNDMLSAHQPFERFPEIIKNAAREAGGTAQVACGVPAMCDGVTQGLPGMELSLFSRDVIALAAGVGLSHNSYDAALFLGVCDKIVPGLVIAAATFGHLPAIFVPAGPMLSGLPNNEKADVRQRYSRGEATRDELMKAEMASYHGPGTCTFYGTANTNQMLMEFMGLHLPGSSFVNPNTELRDNLTKFATKRSIEISAIGNEFIPVADILSAKTFVNSIVGLHATGGSTNLTIHLIAMARAAGIILTWKDMADLSEIVPLMARVYPNGLADVNHFNAAGGLGYVIGELLGAGLLHEDVNTIMGKGLSQYTKEPFISETGLQWKAGTTVSLNDKILKPYSDPFQNTGGLKVLEGNLGEAVIKTSSITQEHHLIKAKAMVFYDQQEIKQAFRDGKLNRDVICVLPYQGPMANGMPELHSLTPILSSIQSKGFKVALLTDGRMSGASGKVPAAIHVTPEAAKGGKIAFVQDGDEICLDVDNGKIELLVDDKVLASRTCKQPDLEHYKSGTGRELFQLFRDNVGDAASGGSPLFGN